MVFGILLVVIGLLVVLEKMGIIPDGTVWGFFWPALLIILGVALIVKSGNRRRM